MLVLSLSERGHTNEGPYLVSMVMFQNLLIPSSKHQNISIVKSIYCSARKKSMCGENTLITVSHNAQDTQRNLFMLTFSWEWWSLTLTFVSLSLQFRFIWMGLHRQWRTASSSSSQNLQCNLAFSIHCHMYLCQGVYNQWCTDFLHFKIFKFCVRILWILDDAIPISLDSSAHVHNQFIASSVLTRVT